MAAEQQIYKDRITTNPQVMVGKPVVKGTRIPVELVLAHLAENPDLTDLFAAYPDLTLEEVKELSPQAVARSREGIRKAAGSWKAIDTEAFKAYIAQRRHTANRPSVKL
jgi:uncharacterized protein (DUF433 family)